MRERKAERNRQIYEERKNGAMCKDIAEKYGLSRGRVTKIIQNEERQWTTPRQTEPRRRGRGELLRYIKEKRGEA